MGRWEMETLLMKLGMEGTIDARPDQLLSGHLSTIATLDDIQGHFSKSRYLYCIILSLFAVFVRMSAQPTLPSLKHSLPILRLCSYQFLNKESTTHIVIVSLACKYILDENRCQGT
ncbi:hypothetical protein BJX64DRAFT_247209 [Aspergillus heterothallicus]